MSLLKRLLKNRRLFLVAAAVLAVTASLAAGYFWGFNEGIKTPKEVKVSEFKNLESDNNEEAVDFGLFWETWEKVKENYISSNKTDNKKLLYGAISGMVAAFGDPYTQFFSPEEAKEFAEEINGEFTGVGIEIGIRDNQLAVIAPLKNTPAFRAGIVAGDKILEIDGKTTAGMSQDEAVKLIRGARNTKVVLLIGREGEDEPLEISIIRDVIQIPTLDWEMKDDIAYIQLYNFYDKATMSFYQAAVSALSQRPKGIVLDLRNNPGGLLDAAVNIAGWFLEKGKVIVKEEFATHEPQIFTAPFDGYLKDIPVVILVNKGSASASEILTGALRDNRGVKLVGETTFGKGTVQELMSLTEGAEVKITIAHWVMPGGEILDEEGLKPDFEVELTRDDEKNNRDPQLDKAMEVIRAEIK